MKIKIMNNDNELHVIKLQNNYIIEDETSTGKGKILKNPGLDEILKKT